jgi:hypothetical protein
MFVLLYLFIYVSQCNDNFYNKIMYMKKARVYICEMIVTDAFSILNSFRSTPAAW